MIADAAARAALSFVFYRPSNEAVFRLAPSPYSAIWFTRI
jgi:hypothetical protein